MEELIVSKNKFEEMLSKNDTVVIELMLTYDCNFRCKYCFERELQNNCGKEIKNKYITLEVLDDAIKYIDWVTKVCNKRVNLFFWGGEPTLALDKIDYMVERFKDDSNIKFFIIINGSEVKELNKIINKVTNSKDRFSVQISYDLSLQNSQRSPNSEDLIIQNLIYMLVQQNSEVVIKSTISINNLDKMFSMYTSFLLLKELLNKNKISNKLSIGITIDTTGFFDGTDDEFEELLNKFQNEVKKILILKNKFKELNIFFLKGFHSCTAGFSFLSIDIDGSIYPCHGAITSSTKNDHYFGNIKSFKDTSLFKIDNITDKHFSDICINTCDYGKKSCGGVCPIHSYERSKKKDYFDRWFDYKSDKLCRINKKIKEVLDLGVY